jgi:hypothetical protein
MQNHKTADDVNDIEPFHGPDAAIVTAHWPGKSVNVCARHAAGLQNIARAMGFALVVMLYDGDEPCINCVNEAKKSTR